MAGPRRWRHRWRRAGAGLLLATLVACGGGRFAGEPSFVVEDAEGLVATVTLQAGDDLAEQAGVERSVCVEVEHRGADHGEICAPAMHGGMVSIGYGEGRTLVLGVAEGPHRLHLRQGDLELISDREGHVSDLGGFRVHLIAVHGPDVDDQPLRALLRSVRDPSDRPVEHELLAGEGARTVAFPTDP